MVSQISLGTVNQVNGKTVLTGSQSGIDTASLINELATAKAMPATTDQTKITANQAKITAYTSLKTALSTLETSLDALRNPPITSNATNAFAARSPFLTVDNGGTATNYLGVATNNNAPIGNYSMQVDHLATAETDESGSFSSESASVVNAATTNTAGQFAAGTFKINGVSINLQQGDTLLDVASAINSQTSNTGVTANIVQLSSTSFKLQLTGQKTGAANAIAITDTNGVLPSAGAVMGTTYKSTTNSSTQTMFQVTQAAQDSQIEFGTSAANMETVTRSTNQITDLLANTTISLYGPTNGATVSLSIDNNNTGIATAVSSFVTAYNAIRTFQAQQTAINPTTGAPLSSAVLNSDSTLNTVMNELSSLISGQASIAIPSIDGGGSNTTAPLRMGDLGITLDNIAAGTDANGNTTPAVTNILDLDASSLAADLESYFTQTANIFQFNFNASSSDLGIFSRDNTVTSANFGIVVDTSQPVGSQAKITSIDGSALTSPIALQYKTTTTEQSLGFSDTTSSVVNAGGTDTAGQFAAGTFQINGVNVTLNQGDNLQQVVNDINVANTGVTASIVQTGSGSSTAYTISLTGTANGTSGVNITDPSGVLPSEGMFTVQNSSSQINGMPNTDLSGFNFAYKGDGNETIQQANTISSKDFTLSINPSAASGSQAEITQIFGATLATPIAMTYKNEGISASITGVAGTPFAGLSMVFTGSGAENVNVSMSQGIADQLYNAVDGLVNGVGGSAGIIDSAINTLTSQDTKLQTDITNINSQVSDYRNQLLTTYSNLEASISSANSILSLLSAQSNAELENVP